LYIELVGNAVQISWDAVYAGFILETTPTLSDSNFWTAVPTQVVPISTNRVGVTLPLSGLAGFFRLRGTAVAGCAPGNYLFPANVNPACFLNWSRLFVQDTVPEGSIALYSVGRGTGTNVLFDLGPEYTHVSIGPDGLDLTGVNRRYTNLVLRAEYSLTTGSNSPCLDAWQFTYDSPCWPSFTFTVRVDGRGADSCGALAVDNTASISTTTPEITLANNTAAHNMIVRLTDLKVNMAVNKAAALPTETLTYTLAWSVTGPQPAPKAYLKVTLADGNADGIADVNLVSPFIPPFVPPPGVTAFYHTASTLTPPPLDPDNPPASGWIPWTGSALGANHVAFLLGDRDPNSAGVITYTATVNSDTAGRTLVSTLAGVTARRESDCANSGSALTYIGRLANAVVTKTGPGCLHPGNLAVFTINYGNNGNTAAVNVVVGDVLPPGLTFVSAVPQPSSVVGQNLTWNNLGATASTLGAGETGVITVVAQLTNDCALIGQTLFNVTTISTSNEQVSLADDRAEAVLNCITPDTVSIGGYVYQDRNANCLREPGERGIPGAIITLTGTVPCSTPVTLTAVTDENGQYNFPGLKPGTYTVKETQPSPWISTGDALGTINGTARGSNPQPLDNTLGPITINGGETALEYNFCENVLPPVLVGVPGNTNYQCLGDVPPPPTVTATDSCDGNTTVTLTISTNGSCPIILTYTWEARDRCGNSTSATSTVTVRDTLPPVITCPTNFSVQCLTDIPACASSLAQFMALGGTARDNCDSNLTYTCSDGPLVGGICGGTIRRTHTVMDDCTNAASCVQIITIHDTIPPVITCPTNFSVQCLTDVPAVPASLSQFRTLGGAAGDNCDSNLTYTCSDGPLVGGICGGTIRRTYTVTDDCTNAASCVQIITIHDTIPPMITCQPDRILEWVTGAVPVFANPAATDNCDTNLTITFVDGELPAACPSVRVFRRTWTATDDCTNSASCSQTITFVDTTPPVITCQPDRILEWVTGSVPVFGNPTASDTGDTNVTITFVDSQLPAACPAARVFRRTWTATDDCTNRASCSQTITFVDTTPPVLMGVPANHTFQCLSEVPPPAGVTAADNGDTNVEIRFFSITNGTCPTIISNFWIAIDDCTNTTSASQAIIIHDTIPPVLAEVPGNTNYQCLSDVPPPANVTATDNCDGSIPVTLTITTNGSCPAVLTYTWLARDRCTNSASATRTVTVFDTIPPILAGVPGNTNYQCLGDVPPPASVTASDNCDGSIPVTLTITTNGSCPTILTYTWLARDRCTNSASATRTITVLDTIPPVLACASNRTVVCAQAWTFDGPSATDNCTGVIIDIVGTVTNASLDGSSVATRIWVATDACGNQAQCSQSVTILPCPPGGGCRVTGGSNRQTNVWQSACITTPVPSHTSHGGQVGAPFSVGTPFTPNSPCISGEWQHNRHLRNGNHLAGTFHAAGNGNQHQFDSLLCACLACAENPNAPGIVGDLCNPGDRVCGPEPRQARANKICFSGVGDYTFTSGNKTVKAVFRVDIEDHGEGNSPSSTPPADRYRIRLWILDPACGRNPDPDSAEAMTLRFAASADPAKISTPATTEDLKLDIPPDIDDGGNLTQGNHQIHPETGSSCGATVPAPAARINVSAEVACLPPAGAGLYGMIAQGLQGTTDPVFAYRVTITNSGTVTLTNLTVAEATGGTPVNTSSLYFSPGQTLPPGGSVTRYFALPWTVNTITTVVVAGDSIQNGASTVAASTAVAIVQPAETEP
jgi:uncharacterized repeat protein (TIGR01451 family)